MSWLFREATPEEQATALREQYFARQLSVRPAVSSKIDEFYKYVKKHALDKVHMRMNIREPICKLDLLNLWNEMESGKANFSRKPPKPGTNSLPRIKYTKTTSPYTPTAFEYALYKELMHPDVIQSWTHRCLYYFGMNIPGLRVTEDKTTVGRLIFDFSQIVNPGPQIPGTQIV